MDNYFLIGCESIEVYETDKIINFWSNKFMKKRDREFRKNGLGFFETGQKPTFQNLRASVIKHSETVNANCSTKMLNIQ